MLTNTKTLVEMITGDPTGLFAAGLCLMAGIGVLIVAGMIADYRYWRR